MGKCKFEQELEGKLGGTSLAHLVPEQKLQKKQKLPPPPKIGARPILLMRLSWDDAPEIIVTVMLDCGANVRVVSEQIVEKHKVLGVLRSRACGFAGFDGQESSSAGQAYTLPCTLRIGDHHSKETFEISPLQDDHDVHLPWWWTIQHPTQYLITGIQSDLKFDHPKCKDYTEKAMTEFTVEYDDSVAYYGED